MAKNRVIETKIDALIPDDKNLNQHTEFGTSLLEKSVERFGLGRSILLDKNNRIIAGNGITETAGSKGLEDVIIVETTGDKLVAVKRTDIDLDSREGRELALADNATANANLSWDVKNMAEVTTEYSIDPQEWGVSEFAPPAEPEKELKEDDFTPPDTASIKTSIKRGDLFEIRKGGICHRLLCGDSADIADVERLMAGKEADLIVTDPPYNVDYASKNEMLNAADKGNRVQTDIVNDAMDDDHFKAFLETIYSNYAAVSRKGAAIYVFHASREAVNFINGLRLAGFAYKQQLIWVKNNIVIGRQDYQWQHEPIIYGWKEGGPHYFVAERNNRTVIEDKIDLDAMSKKELLEFAKEMLNDAEHPTTVIHEDKPLVNAEHPTMKPVKLCGRFIKNSSRAGELVVDFFLGSGSTLIASHQLDRNCYGIEISPEYCQVILDRIKLFDKEVEITKL
ncbi:MAG: DNA modification methylase [Clostridia bacterium]|nr:DNA modification methylase [Clostridia bacterium]